MSAPHYLEYDVLFNGNKISSFYLDVDLDNPVEVFEEVSKLFKTEYRWFDAKVLFRFCEYIYYAASNEYFVLEDHWYNLERGELRLVLTDVKDYGWY